MRKKDKYSKRIKCYFFLKKKSVIFTAMTFVLMLSSIIVYAQIDVTEKPSTIIIYPDSVLSNVSHHPIGINLNYFMDDDNYLKPERKTSDALKAMGVRYLRYPGGNKSDSYFFSSPPYAKSEPTLARTGPDATGGRGRMLKDYKEFKFDVLDFDEFIKMCRIIDAEPIVVVAADEYLVDYAEGSTWSTREELINHAIEWVKYANIKKGYNIKYWMIGNESWNHENKNSSAEIYANDVVNFSKAMKAVDPTIYIIPNGNSEDFWKKVITIAGDYVDLLCISNYPVWKYKAGYLTYRDTLQNLMGPVDKVKMAVKKYATPEQKEKWKLIVAEYGVKDYGGGWQPVNNMGANLANFELTGELLCEPFVKFSCFWNTRWINNDLDQNAPTDALDKHGNLNPIGTGLMIWGNYLKKYMVKTTGTTHLRLFASTDDLRETMYVYLINKADKDISLEIKIEGYRVDNILFTREMVSRGHEDLNPVWRERELLEEIDLKKFSVPHTSITLLELQLK